MHIRLIESGNDGKRVAIDAEGDLAAVVRRIVADKLGCDWGIAAIRFDLDTAVLFNSAGGKAHRLAGEPARELREKLGVLYPALLL